MQQILYSQVITCPEKKASEHQSRSDLIQGIIYTCVGVAAIFLNAVGASVYKKRGFNKAT